MRSAALRLPALAVVALLVLSGRAAADTFYAKPGDTGTATLTIHNAAGDSDEAIAGVKVEPAASGAFSFSDGAVGPTDIQVGSQYTFSVGFTVQGVADGRYDLTLIPTAARPDEDRGLSEKTTSVVVDGSVPGVIVYDGDNEVADDDGGGSGSTEGNALDIEVDDETEDGLPGSGVARLEVWKDDPDSGQLLGTNTEQSDTAMSYSAESAGLSVLANLPVGRISLRAYDRAGNSSVVFFTVHSSLPQVTLSDGLGRFSIDGFTGVSAAPFPTSTSGSYALSIIAGPGTGLASVTLKRGDADVSSALPAMASSTTLSGALTLPNDPNTGSPDGTYTLTAVNDAGDQTVVIWTAAVLDVDASILGVESVRTSSNAVVTYQGNGEFNTHINIASLVKSSLGIATIEPADQVDIQLTFGGQNTDEIEIIATDVDGNTSDGSIHLSTDIFPMLGAMNVPVNGSQPMADSLGRMLDGAIAFAGPYVSPIDGEMVPTPGARIEAYVSGSGSGPLVSTQPIATTTLNIDGCKMMTEDTSYVRGQGIVHQPQYFGPCPITSQSQASLSGTVYPQTAFADCASDDGLGNCTQGNVYSVFGDIGGTSYGITALGTDPPFNKYDPGQTTAALPFGIHLSSLNLSTSAVLTTGTFSQRTPLGYQDIRSGVGYSVAAAPYAGGQVGLLSPVTITLAYGPTGLSAAQESAMVVLSYSTSGAVAVVTPSALDVNSHTVSFQLPGFGAFKLAVPTVGNLTSSGDGLTVAANQPLRISDPSSDARARQLLNVLAAQGLSVVGGHAWIVSSTAPAFSPAAVVQVQVRDQDIMGLDPSRVSVLQYDLATGQAQSLFSERQDAATLTISAYDRSASPGSLLALLYNGTAPGALMDLLPPVTSLSAGSVTLAASATPVTVSSTMTFTVAAVDPSYASAPVSGAAETRYLLDAAFDSTTTTPGQAFTFPFRLKAGPHTIVAYSRDAAGNVEAPELFTLNVVAPVAQPQGGSGIGSDETSQLWSTFFQDTSVSVARNGSDGVALASTTIPGADPALPWSVIFVSSGTPAVVGSVVDGSGNDSVAAFALASGGDSLVGGLTFSDPGRTDFVFQAAAPGWIVGASQAQGGVGPISLALWRLDPVNGLIQQTTSYSRAGFDEATGLAVDADGDLWVAGFSQSPAPRSPRTFDLAVWKYASDGHTLLAGPIVREGYLGELDTSLTAEVLVASGTVFVAAPRGRAEGGTDMALLTIDGASARVLSEGAWRADDGSDLKPAAVLQDAFGRAVVAGRFDYGDATLAGLWRYGPDGSLVSASSLDSGGAEGGTFAGSSLWLAVDGSTVPYFAAGESAVSGSASDVLAPTTVLTADRQAVPAAGTVVSTETVLALAASDDAVAAGDKLGAGVKQTFLAVDGSAYSASTSSFAFAQLGLHSLSFYSLDQEGNAEIPQTVDVVVASGTIYGSTAPVGVTVTAVASTTVDLAWNPNGNPTQAEYTVGFTTVADASVCADGPLTNQLTVTQDAAQVGGLISSQGYRFVVCAPQADGTGLCAAPVQVMTAAAGQGSSSFVAKTCGSGGEGGGGGGGGTQGPEKGLAISADPSGKLWEAADDGGIIKVARFGASGQELSVALPNAYDRDGAFTIRFDRSGNAYAIGTATNPSGGTDIAVYKVSSAGQLVSSATFHAGDSSPAVAWDANGDLWITGFIQTGTTESSPLSMGLWHYSTAMGQVTQTASFTRGGPVDVGFGVRTLDSSVYVEGYTSTVPLSTPSLGRALWKFDSQGHGPVAGPFIDYDYLRNLNPPISARLEVSSGTLYAATPRTDDSGVNVLGFARYDANGTILSDHYVSFQDFNFTPSAIGIDVQGDVAVAASVSGPQGAGYGVARFARDGGLIDVWAAGNSTASVQGMAVLGSDLWLAIDGSTVPVRFVGGFQVPATDVMVSSGPVDAGDPATQLQADGVAVSSGATLASGTTFTLLAADPPDGSGLSSGVAETLYWLDVDPFACDADYDPSQPAGTCANPVYSGPFQLSVGTHTVSFQSTDAAGNSEDLQSVAVTVVPTLSAPPQFQVAPATGPVGIPFTIAGSGFGAYAGASTRVTFGGVAAPVSAWNDTTIQGTIPGLPAGTYAVAIERLSSSTSAGTFQVLLPSATALSPLSAPIGQPFSIAGTAFGPYAGALTRVRFGGVIAPISVWNDAQISGTLPSVSTGAQTVVIERAASDGFVAASTVGVVQVALPSIASVAPSSAPIGGAVTVSGSSFGSYAGALTVALLGGTTCPVSVWNDATIGLTVPGSLAAGTYPLIVERLTADGGVSQSAPASFQVAASSASGLSATSGPIGVPLTVTGSGFGAYLGANSRLRIGDRIAPVSLWNDTTISGTIPGLAAGTYSVLIERQQGADVAVSTAGAFTVTTPAIASLAPSSGPIGAAFTLSGGSFGPYAGSLTVALLGGATVPVSVWNDATITGTVPGALMPGTYPLIVERTTTDGGLAQSSSMTYTVAAPFAAALSPSTGPIGIPFTLTGRGFGSYLGANTRVRIGGVLAPISVWNDTTIQGTIPGIAPGGYAVCVEIQQGSSVAVSTIGAFGVLRPSLDSLSPASAPVGNGFTVHGSAFGPYAGALTVALIGGATAPISVWNDATITGTVPGALSPGTYPLVVERLTSDGFSAQSDSATFQVAGAGVASMTPSTGPIGVAFTIAGSGFGAYLGADTRVRIGGALAPISVWNDSTIQGTIPGISSGSYSVLIEEQQGSFVSVTTAATFGVTAPAVASMTPSSAPIGAPFTILGSSFGPYGGSATQVLFGATAAPISVWNDTTISGTVPGALAPGSVGVVVRRAAGGVNADAPAGTFAVLQPAVSTITPASGEAGSAFELDGYGFGPYAGSQTKVLVGGVAAAISVWNDQLIRGAIPDSLSVGTYTVVVERSPSGGTVQSDPVVFTVGTPIGGAALSSSLAVAHPAWYYQAALTLPASEGGVVTAPSRAAVQIPPSAVAQDLPVTIDRAPTGTRDETLRASARGASALGKAGDAVEYGPEGTQFAAPVTISLPYDPDAVPLGALATLAVHYWNKQAGEWQPLNSQVDPLRHLVTARTSHFSVYQVLAPAGLLRPQAAASSTVDTVQVACNPLRRGCRPMAFQNLPAGARIRLYTLAGNLVKDFSADGSGTATWDGTNQDGQPAASGVYLLYAQGAGGKKLLKVAVQR